MLKEIKGESNCEEKKDITCNYSGVGSFYWIFCNRIANE